MTNLQVIINYHKSLVQEDACGGHVVDEHAPAFVECQPEDPIDQKLHDELEEEEDLRDCAEDGGEVDLREVAAVGADVVQQTALTNCLPGVEVGLSHAQSHNYDVRCQQRDEDEDRIEQPSIPDLVSSQHHHHMQNNHQQEEHRGWHEDSAELYRSGITEEGLS
jgi:hypothetical protein